MVKAASAKQEVTALEWTEPARLVTRSLLLDIAVSPDRVIAVGERGHVLLSSDQGRNWTQVLVPTQSMLNAVTVVGDRHSWIVGHDAVILHSADKGETWIRQNFDPQNDIPLFDVWFGGIKRGVAVGAYGFAVETRDGGKNWDRFPIAKEDPHLYTITEGPNHHLYVVGEFGSIFRSQDLGKTWHALDSPYKGTFFGVLAPSNGALMVFGLRGTVFRSLDEGENWQKIETGASASLLNALELVDGTIIIVGSAGTVLRSQDGGQSLTPTTRADRKDISAIATVSQEHLITAGESGLRNIRSPSSFLSESKDKR